MSHARKSNIQAIYPLSPMQQGILFNAQRETQADPYFMQLHVGLEGRLNAELFHQAWLHVIARHDVFRTLFVFEKRDIPLQLVQSRVRLPWCTLDWRAFDPASQQKRLETFLKEDRDQGLPLDKAPLMRMTLIQTAPQSNLFVWSTHHILLDAWCKKLVLDEVSTIYQKLVTGQRLNLVPATPYQHYIKWLGRQDINQAKSFWRDFLAGFTKATLLPRDQSLERGRVVSGDYGALTYRLKEPQTDALVRLARAHRLTLNAMVQACWAATLHSFSGSKDILFGVTLSGRPEELPGVDAMIGLFINTLPLRITYDATQSLSNWLETIQSNQMALTRYSYSPLYEIRNWCDRRERSPLFDSILIFQNYPREKPQEVPSTLPQEAQLSLAKIEVTGRANYPISLTASLRSDLNLQLNYDANQFQENTIQLMMNRLRNLLEHMAQSIELPVAAWLQSACFPDKGSSQMREGLEALLLTHPDIANAAVCFLPDREGTLKAVGYIIPKRNLHPTQFLTKLQQDKPFAQHLTALVAITSLPITTDGLIDHATLRQIPIPDSTALVTHQQQMESTRAIEDCAVILQPIQRDWQRSHLNDLLPPELLQNKLQPPIAFKQAQSDSTEFKQDLASRPLALAHGGPLQMSDKDAKTLIVAFQQTIQHHSHEAIIHVSSYGEETVQTYASLYQDACKILGGLQAQGLTPGDRILLQINDSPTYFSLFWACILGGIQPVTVAIPPSYSDDHSLNQKIHKAWELIGAPPLVASQELVGPLDALRTRFQMDPFHVLCVEELASAPASTRFHHAKPEETAFLQLTSGSTGTPKCIPERHQAIIAHIQGSKKHNAYTPGDRFMNWMPMDHIGSILKYHIGVLYSGYTQLHAAPDLIIADPLKWFDLMEKHRITHSWSPNFGFKLVVTELQKKPDRRWDLAHLKFLLNAGEQVTMPVLRDFTKLVAPFGLTPKVFQPAFGMAETCTGITYQTDFNFENGVRCVSKQPTFEPLTFLDPDQLGDSPAATYFVSLGPPMPGVEIRITGADQSLLPEGVIGHFQVKGDMVLNGYLNHPTANEASYTEDGWFKTGDLGFILDTHLYITGREKEMIVINGANYYCYEIEEQVNQVPGVKPTFAAAVSVHTASNDQEELAIFFVPEEPTQTKGYDLIETIRANLAKGIGLPAQHIIPLLEADFPKTTSGKIQRNHLRQSFEAGQYASIQAEIDLYLGNANTLPQWFYEPVWRREQFRHIPKLVPKTLLFFCEEEPFATRFTSWEHPFEKLVVVTHGKTFSRYKDDWFCCDPQDISQIIQLLQALEQLDFSIEKITCFWKHDSQNLEARAAYWLPLIQTLGKRRDPSPVHLQMMTLNTAAVSEKDHPDPEAAGIVSLLKTAALEMTTLETSSLDLDNSSLAEPKLLLRELASIQPKQVALREGCRYVLTLQPIELTDASQTPLLIEQGGMVIVTGGLGGIGQLLAEKLIDQFDARLLLIGRTALNSSENHQATAETATRMQAWKKLSDKSDTIAYAAADVCSEASLKQLIEHYENRWSCKLSTVFHLAGVAEERPLLEEHPDHFQATIAAKVAGARALHGALENRPEVHFVAFSSVNGYFGANRFAAYASACGFLDSFASWRRSCGFPHTQSLAWTQWQDCGMSKGFQFGQVAQARGFTPLSQQEGLMTWLVAMGRKAGVQLLGIDHTKPYISHEITTPAAALHQLHGYFVTPTPANRNHETQTLNQFAGIVSCQWHSVETIPRNEHGELETAALLADSQNDHRKQPYVAPRNQLEKQLASLWKELLGVPKVGIHDNYFELGGHSINATQLLLRLRSTLQVDLPLQSLFDKPTIAEIAAMLSAENEGAPKSEPSANAFEQDLHLANDLGVSPDLSKSKGPAKCILLTGSTGFIGAYLLETLLAETKADIWCLVRATDDDAASQRLKQRLLHYRISLQENASRVKVIAGDLAKPKLGLSQQRWQQLAKNLDVIYHNGALVNFVLPYAKLREANVLGTLELLRLSATSQLKHVHFISTLSAIPASLHASQPFPEDGDSHQELGELNGYERSKWVAEALIKQAINQGIPATIVRLGRISGHSSRGVSAESDMIVRLIQGSLMAGVIPQIPLQLQMLPVDFTCLAILALTTNQALTGSAFHLFNPHGATLAMLRDAAVEQNFELEQVSPAIWLERLSQQAQSSPDHPLFPLFNLLQQMNASKAPETNKQHSQPYDQQHTQTALAQAHLTFPKVDMSLLNTYFHYFQEAGWLEKTI